MKVKKTIYISSNELSEKLLKKAELTPSQDGIPATFDSSLCGFRFDGKTLYYGKPVGKSLVEFARGFKGEPFEKRFSSRFDELGFTFDSAKNKIYKKETLEEMLLLLSVLGYTKAYFMMEDCVEIEDEPYYGYMRYRYQSKDLKELDAFAKSVGIELIPQIPSLTGFSKTVR